MYHRCDCVGVDFDHVHALTCNKPRRLALFQSLIATVKQHRNRLTLKKIIKLEKSGKLRRKSEHWNIPSQRTVIYHDSATELYGMGFILFSQTASQTDEDAKKLEQRLKNWIKEDERNIKSDGP